ncbi:hypothetical protein BDF20DRAFT_38018 [Mycotypha africana]|uniref:uncharacterized protein n=1 Tax=Mycotypha africana TaxID=64632 RepID=UPI002301C5CF|nr:uncharacterized protein BDF20DRAFT_38018 [Mycotypha africana]KAI8991364.1 hypothetical protein BDF20DRAFT_38018 [Mycotypha africana]
MPASISQEMPICHSTFQELYDKLVQLFHTNEGRKDLEYCGVSIYSLFESTLKATLVCQGDSEIDLTELLSKAKALTDYCDEAILLYHFKEVPDHWRRMLMDSGLLNVMIQLKGLISIRTASEAPTDFEKLEPKVQSMMSELDICLVVSGAPGPDRRSTALLVLDELQAWLTAGRRRVKERQEAPSAKRLKVDVGERQKTEKEEGAAGRLKYPIERLTEAPSFEWFLAHCNQEIPTPFILPKGCGIIDEWPAFKHHPWKSTEYLLSVAADRVVPVEIGSQYTDADWSQKMMRFSDFVQEHIVKQEKDGPPAYLAQHDVFYQIPRLERDIIIPDYCYIEAELNDSYVQRTPQQEVLKNAWFGPKGTVSPLHQDPYHNLLCQVVGSKYLKLISHQQTPLVYPREGLMTNTSQIDVEHPDVEKFPAYKEVHYLECILQEGEVLYIPPKWWHFVKSLETSFSVSLWF